MDLKLQIQQLENELQKNLGNPVISILLKDKIDELKKELLNETKKKKRIKNREIKYLTEKEFNKLIITIENTQDRYWLRDKLLFLLAFECGLRASEIGDLKINEFSYENSELFCRRLKGSRNNTIKITEETSNLLNYYIHNKHRESEYIFISNKGNKITKFTLNKICKKYFKLANLPMEKSHFHTIKHTAGVHLA